MRKIIICCGIFSIVCTISSQITLPRDNNGWTLFTPSVDSRIVYVSSSGGDDAAGVVYTKDSLTVGADPLHPAGTVRAFKTPDSAYARVRNGQPDWVLFKRGDVWNSEVKVKDGRSATEPSLAAGYGAEGDAPLFKTLQGINRCCHEFRFIAVCGLAFYASSRDPASEEYAGPEGSTGFNFYVNDGDTGTGLLVEGCSFRFFTNNVIQGPGYFSGLIVRRCLFLDDYSADSHSQGMYTNGMTVVLEENIFDHNGWLIRQIENGNEQDSGQATMFNHNTYFSNPHDVVFRGNMFLRASSIGNKWTANSGEASARNITIDDNFYAEGEIGISMGGNETDPPYRFKNITVTNNVFTDIGRDQPTNRTLGWYMEMNDWDGGLVAGNLFIHDTSTVVSNVYALKLIGQSRNVTIRGNIVHNLSAGQPLVQFDNGVEKSGIVFSGNDVQTPGIDAQLVNVDSVVAPFSFADNRYYSERAMAEWFTAGKTRTAFAGWISVTHETGSETRKIDYPEAGRTIEQYNATAGGEATWASFIAEVRKQSRYNWRDAYTAAAVNRYFRQGFGKEAVAVGRPGAVHFQHRFQGRADGGRAYYTLQGRRIHAAASLRLPAGVLIERNRGGVTRLLVRMR